MNPTAAQIKRMTGGGPLAIVVVHPPVPEDTSYIIVGQDLLDLPAPNQWQPLPHASALGVGILYLLAPPTSSLPFFTLAADTNATLQTLTLDCDPRSPSFGVPARSSSSGVAFKFADASKNLTKAVLEPLVAFIDERFAAIETALAGPGGMACAIEEYEGLTPQAFRVVFKKFRADRDRAFPGKGWAAVECPVATSLAHCETCGRAEEAVGAGGKGLLRCGRCKRVRYCGKGCQVEDWRAHRAFCKK